jgi:protein O-GlcNAc transferase
VSDSTAAARKFALALARIEALGADNSALVAARTLTATYPNHPASHEALGKVALLRGDAALARIAFEAGLRLVPGNLGLTNSLAMALCALGLAAQAASLLRQALERAPATPQLWHNLGHAAALADNGPEAGIAEFARALELAPDYAEARADLGHALRKAGRLDEAHAHFTACLDVPHVRRTAVQGLADLRAAQARGAEIQDLMATHAAETGLTQDALFYANYDETLAPADLAQRHFAWGVGVSRAARQRKLPRAYVAGQRPLRIGFLSPDLRRHPVSWFVRPLLEGADSARASLHLYADANVRDAVSDDLAARAASWNMVAPLDEDALAAKLRADRIDLLIDLAGHSQGNRLPLFARRLAPYQATWLGYANTTGLASFDFRLVDAITDPPGTSDALAAEPLQRIEGCFLCYGPPADAPMPFERAPDAAVTFGSANNFLKIGPKTISLWAQLLNAVPAARLKLRSFRLFAAAEARAHVESLFAAHGVDPTRLSLVGPADDGADVFGFYRDVDVALDPLIYNGTTTTCEALWMGVPVVSHAGDRHAARVGASLMAAVGRADLVAESESAYLEIALLLAAEGAPPRWQLRQQMAASALVDARLFGKRWLDAVEAGLAKAG